MPPQLRLASSPRRRSATFAMRGMLSRRGAQRIDRALRALPRQVASAHVDLARVSLLDVAALEWLVESLRQWGLDRKALVVITPPAFRRRP